MDAHDEMISALRGDEPASAQSILTAGLGVPERRARIEIIADLVEARKRIFDLEVALRISTNGLRHCSRWNISEETEKAIITQVIANEALLTPNVK